jgi:hypothetical protein
MGDPKYVHRTTAQQVALVVDLLKRTPAGVTVARAARLMEWPPKVIRERLEQAVTAGEAFRQRTPSSGPVYFARAFAPISPVHLQKARGQAKGVAPLATSIEAPEFKPLNGYSLRPLIREGAGGPAVPGVVINQSVYDRHFA